MKQIILINISGEDRPGLTSSLTKVLAEYEVNILDIGQAVIHDNLSLGLLVEVPPQAESSPVLKDLLYKAHELGVQARFTPIADRDYEKWVRAQGKERYIITLLARRLTAIQLSRLTTVVAAHGLNIDKITRLSGRVSLVNQNEDESASGNRACVEFSVRGNLEDGEELRGELMQITDELGVDIGFQADNIYRRNRRLVVFDMDSTLIGVEVIDELAKRGGVGQKVAAITESAMRGEIDFQESFRRRLAMLEGLDESIVEEIANSLPLNEGAERLIGTLKLLGYKTAIISGGFLQFGHKLREKLGVDYVYANQLEVKEGRITGKVSGEIIDGAKKAELLRQIAEQENLSLQQVIAVGDGANDLPMLGIAGLGIAFRAKPIVKQNAGQAISTLGLDGILYLIGVRDREELAIRLLQSK